MQYNTGLENCTCSEQNTAIILFGIGIFMLLLMNLMMFFKIKKLKKEKEQEDYELKEETN